MIPFDINDFCNCRTKLTYKALVARSHHFQTLFTFLVSVACRVKKVVLLPVSVDTGWSQAHFLVTACTPLSAFTVRVHTVTVTKALHDLRYFSGLQIIK